MASGSKSWVCLGGLAVAAALGVGVGLWLGGGVVMLGDEPPIRVKNGSMHFDLDAGGWQEEARCTDGDRGKCWTPDTGESVGVFGVLIDPMPDTCVPPSGSTIDRVTVGYSDGTKVSLKAGAKKGGNARPLRTKLRPHGKLMRDANNGRRLSYGTPGDGGRVAWIELDGDDPQGKPERWTCEFSEKAPLVEACFTATGDVAKCRR